MEPYEIRPASPGAWTAIADLLERSELPLEGLEAHLGTTLVAQEGDRIVGCAALEVYGGGALLRSVAVDPILRGTGMGTALTAAALELARRLQVGEVYLLTETAAAFFAQFGFARIARADVPETVKQSVEFTAVCPASATVMRLDLRVGPS